MASDVMALLVALRAWQKVVKQLKHPGMTATERQERLGAAQQQVLPQLAKPTVAAEIDALIQAAGKESGTNVVAIRHAVFFTTRRIKVIGQLQGHVIIVGAIALPRLASNLFTRTINA